MSQDTPWQLKMFEKTLKKKQRLQALRQRLAPVDKDEKCLLVTCGDNNGAMNYHLRALGGTWSWADLEEQSIQEMSDLLGDPVEHAGEGQLPYDDQTFHRVVSIDVHEHLEDPHPFTDELRRVTRDGGTVLITLPNGNEKKLAVRIKHLVGMTKEKYGHVRVGLDIPELEALMSASNIQPTHSSSFSRFFTEMLELSINFAYVFLLSKKGDVEVEEGTIAPATGDQLKSVEKTYRMYSLIYPFFWLISQLDRLVFFTTGHVVVVEGARTSAE